MKKDHKILWSVVFPAGLEPTTYRLGGDRSVLLSYGNIVDKFSKNFTPEFIPISLSGYFYLKISHFCPILRPKWPEFPNFVDNPFFRRGLLYPFNYGSVVDVSAGANVKSIIYHIVCAVNHYLCASLVRCKLIYSPVWRGPEFARGQAVLALKLTVEVGHVVEAHLVGNSGYVVVGVAQLPACNG